MGRAMISIEVDEGAAMAFARATAEERKKLQLLLGLRLSELMSMPSRSLTEIMDEVGASAESAGLTPEQVESMLTNDGHANGH